MESSEPVDRQAACDAATAAASTYIDGDDVEQTILHSFSHSGPLAMGFDSVLGDVLHDIEHADEVGWVSHPLNHDLAVRRGEHVRYYAVPRPERSQNETLERWALRREAEAPATSRAERTRQIAEEVQQHMRDQYRATSTEPVSEDSNASSGFTDGCDDYSAFAFSAYIDGRQFHVTVEDVTAAEGT